MPAPRSRLKTALLVGALLAAGACLLPATTLQLHVVKTVLRDSYRSLTTTSFEQRRRTFYGDCDIHGYGYVARMTVGFPDATKHPRLRNPKWDSRIVPVVLPGFRPMVEDRVLIAANATERETHESRVAQAERLQTTLDGTQEWRFTTGDDVEVMTGLRLTFPAEPLPPSPVLVKVALVYSADDPIVMRRWERAVQVLPSGAAEFRLPEPVADFSLGRGSLPFVLDVHVLGARPPTALDVLGVTVDTTRYDVVNREGACFVAIRRDLLESLRRRDDPAWSRYIAAIRNVGTH